MSVPTSVADTDLGFTQSELLILRHQQQLLAQQPGRRGVMPDRGRGTSRHSQPSSRAASAASSHSVPNRIVLDPHSLQSLSASLDSLLEGIRTRIARLESATQQSVNASTGRAGASMQSADEQIRRMKAILREIDKLEEDCDRIKRVRDVVRQLRIKVDMASDRLERLSTNHAPRTRRR